MINKKGFSLIEILVGIAIVITATTIVLSIIISSFRISSKTTTNSVLRQNGNYALSQVSRMVQFADSFEGISVSATSARDTCNPGTDYHYLYIVHNSSPVTISCTNSDIRIGSDSSIDTQKVKMVSGSCKFTCSQNPGEGPVIGIKFDLSIGGTGTVVEKNSRVNFSTSVRMRNL